MLSYFVEHTSDIIKASRKQALMINYQHEEGNVRDVTDGTLYKKLAVKFHESDGNLLSYHVTLMLSTDGAPVFKSVHRSIRPLYASVLEIPIERR